MTLAVQVLHVHRNKNVDFEPDDPVKPEIMSEAKKTGKSGEHEIAAVSSGELAEALGVDDRTVRKWIEDGQVTPDARTIGGHARFFPSTVEKLRQAALAR